MQFGGRSRRGRPLSFRVLLVLWLIACRGRQMPPAKRKPKR
ncbi:MAG: hypothetical protein OXG81_12485 [Acidobacteria bacterium]|nr:hypothetical protein [Acidobacteriota bacterium]